MFLAGVDDAGRGPIIGPMVMAGVKIKEQDHERLKEMGCRDSKLLTKDVRERLFDEIHSMAEQVTVNIIHPEEIDAALADPNLNLNTLEAIHFSKIINTLSADKAIIDCPSPNIPAYSRQVKDNLSHNPELVCEHKADLNHPVVAAASIIAKVTRDRIIDELKQEVGIDFGSGYLSDQKTSSFLKEHWQSHPTIFRQSWAPYKALIMESQQKSLGDF